MTAASTVLCSRCMVPCALAGDEVPDDLLCAFCRGSETPGAPRASLLWSHRSTQWPPNGVPRELADRKEKNVDDYETDPGAWTDD